MRLALCLSLALAAPAVAQDAHDDHDDHAGDTHLAIGAGVEVLHAWVNATSGDEALVFAEITNESDGEIMLLGGEAEIAEEVHLVGFRMRGGAESFEEIEGIPFGPGVELVLAPRGLALELHGLSRELVEGEDFEMEFEFDSGHIDLVVQVEAAGAMQHSHAGHSH